MKIAFLGNFTVPYSSESHHAVTLEALGHDVARIQEGDYGDNILAQSNGADLFVWVHSHGCPPSLSQPITHVLNQLSARGVVTLTYHLDLYAGIPARFNEYVGHPFLTRLDHFFSVDPKLVEYLNKAHTQTRGHYLTAGVLESECYLADPSGLTPRDVIFVGSYHYHPEWPYRKQLIDWLKGTYGDGFRGFGPNFDSGSVRGASLNRVYASAKVVVGDSFSPGFDYPGYWSDRIPETLGRGGFLIHPNIDGIGDFYQDGVHLCLYDFNDFDQLKEYIDYYLGNDVEREAIRLAGHQHVKENHTFTNRWREILGTVCG
jgi:hypothetical protein